MGHEVRLSSSIACLQGRRQDISCICTQAADWCSSAASRAIQSSWRHEEVELTHQGLFLQPRQSPECTGVVCRSTTLAFLIASLKLTPRSSGSARGPAAAEALERGKKRRPLAQTQI